MSYLDDESAALDDLAALPGLTLRRLSRADAPAIADTYQAAEGRSGTHERTTAADVTAYWASPRSRPEEDTILLCEDGGGIAAVGWAPCHRGRPGVRLALLGGVVHPDHLGQGVGAAVLRWELAHALAWATSVGDDAGPIDVRLRVRDGDAATATLAQEAGLRPVRWFYEMLRPLDTRPSHIQPPRPELDGIRLVGWDESRSEEARRVLDESFRDHWGSSGLPPQQWADETAAAWARPAWSVLALDQGTGAVVGVAQNAAREEDWPQLGRRAGDTHRLGVLAAHRGRGIGAALLVESMRRFRDAGLSAATLGVDSANPTGALALYERLGYRPISGSSVHRWQGEGAQQESR